MKWFTHQSITVAAAMLLGIPPAGVAGAVLGAVLPDVIDQRLSRLSPNPQRTFNRIHRGPTHWFGWYLALLLVAVIVEPAFLPKSLGTLPIRTQSLSFLAGLSFGALSHVILDMLTPSGVPLHPFSRQRKFSLNLCSTGSMGEYLFLITGLSITALLAKDRWPHILKAIEKFL